MTVTIRRRELLAALGGAVAAWPLAAHAQQSNRMRRIGVLMGLSESDPEAQSRIAAFRKTLQDLGWTEARNVRTDYYWAAGDIDRTHALAKELASSAPDVIVVNTPPGLSAARFTSTPMRRARSPCCACAARGHATATPPSAASNSRRPMVTVIRPSRARVLKRDDTTPPAYSPRPAPGTLHLKIIKISLGLSAVLSAADFLAPGGLMPGEIGRPLERPASLALDVPRL